MLPYRRFATCGQAWQGKPRWPTPATDRANSPEDVAIAIPHSGATIGHQKRGIWHHQPADKRRQAAPVRTQVEGKDQDGVKNGIPQYPPRSLPSSRAAVHPHAPAGWRCPSPNHEDGNGTAQQSARNAPQCPPSHRARRPSTQNISDRNTPAQRLRRKTPHSTAPWSRTFSRKLRIIPAPRPRRTKAPAAIPDQSERRGEKPSIARPIADGAASCLAQHRNENHVDAIDKGTRPPARQSRAKTCFGHMARTGCPIKIWRAHQP